MNPSIRPIPVVALAVFLTIGCGGKKNGKSGAAADPNADPLTAVSPKTTAIGGPVPNRYADREWPSGEPETKGEKDYEAAATVEEKLEVIGQLESTDPAELAPVVRRALRHPDENFRVQALQTTGVMFTTPDLAADVITGATHDESSEVRAIAMEMAREQQLQATLKIYEQAINSQNQDVRDATAVELGRLSTKPAYEILIRGLSNPDPQFVEKVNEEIHLLINQRFDSPDHASTWWAENSSKYDERLNRVEE